MCMIPVSEPFSTLVFLFDNLLVPLVHELLSVKFFGLVLSIDVLSVFNKVSDFFDALA